MTSIDYDPIKNSIRFKPKKKGCRLFSFKRRKRNFKTLYRFCTRNRLESNLLMRSNLYLEKLMELKLLLSNNKVVVDGEIFIPRDIRRISNVVGQ